ncbi:MAG: NADH-quinone oxidoreductase subunit, partial [Mycobacteriales bacterium]
RAALLGGAGWLAVAVAINTVIGLAYYLRLAALPFRAADPAVPAELVGAPEPVVAGGVVATRMPAGLVAAIGLAALLVLVLGVLPQLVLGGAVVPGP